VPRPGRGRGSSRRRRGAYPVAHRPSTWTSAPRAPSRGAGPVSSTMTSPPSGQTRRSDEHPVPRAIASHEHGTLAPSVGEPGEKRRLMARVARQSSSMPRASDSAGNMPRGRASAGLRSNVRRDPVERACDLPPGADRGERRGSQPRSPGRRRGGRPAGSWRASDCGRRSPSSGIWRSSMPPRKISPAPVQRVHEPWKPRSGRNRSTPNRDRFGRTSGSANLGNGHIVSPG
jgi:hypothetical protein